MGGSSWFAYLPAAVLALPLVGAAMLGWLGLRRGAEYLNLAFSVLGFALACLLGLAVALGGPLLALGQQLYADALNTYLVLLTTFVAAGTAAFSVPYMRVEQAAGRLGGQRLRLYHGMFQLFVFTMLLALLSNNLGLLWVAMEAATLATVLLVSLYRSPAGLQAAWKYFILCGVGLALALFGTVLVYAAAERVLGGQGAQALLWTRLAAARGALAPAAMSVAFVFVLVGYGTKVGLVPLHSWLPDAHAEGPTPVSAVLSGLLLNVALYAVLRMRVLVEGSVHAAWPGLLLQGFGLLSVLTASLLLWRQKDAKRLFAWSSIAHLGLASFGFGLGTPLASFAALLHLSVHALTKSAIFFSVGHASQKAGSPRLDDIRGLRARSPALGWLLLLGALAIVGLPPFGVFTSEFLILGSALQTAPWSVAPLLLGLLVALAAVLWRVQAMVFGREQEPRLRSLPQRPWLAPAWLHLGLVLLLGLWIPGLLAQAWRAAALVLGSPT